MTNPPINKSPLFISVETLALSGKRLARIDLSQFRAGDRIEARIVDITNAGRAVLQFPGFKATSAKPIEGRVGDVLRFEVLPDASEKAAARHTLTTASRAIKGDAGSQTPHAIRENGKTLQLAVLSKTGGPSRAHDDGSLQGTKPASTSPNSMVPATPFGELTAQSPEILSSWLKRFHKASRRQRGRMDAGRSPGKIPQESRTEQARPRTLDRPERPETNQRDRSGETGWSIGAGTFLLDRRPVKMKMHRRSPGREGDATGFQLAAVFLLESELVGPVRADVQWAGQHLQVGFFVENAESRQHIAQALPDLTAALSRLAAHCYCHVEVSAPKIRAFMEEKVSLPDTARLDVRA